MNTIEVIVSSMRLWNFHHLPSIISDGTNQLYFNINQGRRNGDESIVSYSTFDKIVENLLHCKFVRYVNRYRTWYYAIYVISPEAFFYFKCTLITNPQTFMITYAAD
jgi:hypothetical protein